MHIGTPTFVFVCLSFSSSNRHNPDPRPPRDSLDPDLSLDPNLNPDTTV